MQTMSSMPFVRKNSRAGSGDTPSALGSPITPRRFDRIRKIDGYSIPSVAGKVTPDTPTGWNGQVSAGLAVLNLTLVTRKPIKKSMRVVHPGAVEPLL